MSDNLKPDYERDIKDWSDDAISEEIFEMSMKMIDFCEENNYDEEFVQKYVACCVERANRQEKESATGDVIHA